MTKSTPPKTIGNGLSENGFGLSGRDENPFGINDFQVPC